MRINTNTWNRIRYTALTPIYDIIGRVFTKFRKLSIDGLQLTRGDKVLLVGAGTGLDLEFIEPGVQVTAIDITPAMVNRIKERGNKLGLKVEALVMDGHRLQFPDNTFDKVILHLIIAVIPDPVKCLKEVERVLKVGGKVTVYDKFLPVGQKVTLARKVLNYITNLLFSDINRSFEAIARETGLEVVSNTVADFRGNYRIVILTKQS